MKNEENCFVLPEVDPTLPAGEQDNIDSANLYKLLNKNVLPTFYDTPEKWQQIAFNGIKDVVSAFTSRRMARQYYEDLYK
jgi:starch phosphorylase